MRHASSPSLLKVSPLNCLMNILCNSLRVLGPSHLRTPHAHYQTRCGHARTQSSARKETKNSRNLLSMTHKTTRNLKLKINNNLYNLTNPSHFYLFPHQSFERCVAMTRCPSGVCPTAPRSPSSRRGSAPSRGRARCVWIRHLLGRLLRPCAPPSGSASPSRPHPHARGSRRSSSTS